MSEQIRNQESIIVIGVCGGSGATVVAAALADVAQDRMPATLVDLAPPYTSGLEPGTNETEYAIGGGPGYVLASPRPGGVLKLSTGSNDPGINERFFGRHQVPARRQWLPHATDLVVVDFAWNALEVTLGEVTIFGEWLTTAKAVVLVMPATRRGLARAESIASVLSGLGVVGFYIAVSQETTTPDWLTTSATGPLSHSMGRVPAVPFPRDTDVYLKGANTTFPESIKAAANNLLDGMNFK